MTLHAITDNSKLFLASGYDDELGTGQGRGPLGSTVETRRCGRKWGAQSVSIRGESSCLESRFWQANDQIQPASAQLNSSALRSDGPSTLLNTIRIVSIQVHSVDYHFCVPALAGMKRCMLDTNHARIGSGAQKSDVIAADSSAAFTCCLERRLEM